MSGLVAELPTDLLLRDWLQVTSLQGFPRKIANRSAHSRGSPTPESMCKLGAYIDGATTYVIRANPKRANRKRESVRLSLISATILERVAHTKIIFYLSRLPQLAESISKKKSRNRFNYRPMRTRSIEGRVQFVVATLVFKKW